MFDVNIYNRANQVIAQGALTNSKRPSSFVFGQYPTHIQRAHGPFLYDSSGRKYLDYICGLGVHLFGYGDAQILDGIITAYKSGSVFSLSSNLEIEYGEKIKSIFGVDRVRYFKSGSEACQASIRIARSYNQKSLILSDGYHGWHEEFVSLTPPSVGCVNNFQIVKFTALDQLDLPNISAVIIEPIITDYSEERFKFLSELRDKCTKRKIVLIFDETITGCRFPRYSVSKYLNIDPDLIVLGKAIGGGLPLSIVGGRRDIMESGEYFTSSTFSGDRVALMASLVLLSKLNKENITSLWNYGEKFINDFNNLSPLIKIEGYPTRGVFRGSDLNKALFFQESIKAGILFGPSFFMSYPAIEYSYSTISACKDILKRIEKNEVKLQGEMPKSPFSMRIRDEK
jgi:glutamate-1-semialdehyde aminotransferase